MNYGPIEYLRSFGLSGTEHDRSMVPCEVCGSEEFTMIAEKIDGGGSKLVEIPVQACNLCGFLMQNPRFDISFYKNYYRDYYKISRSRSDRQKTHRITDSSGGPTLSYIENQVERGKLMLQYLVNYLPKTGTVLDVGSSCGGFLVPFREVGWSVFGNDPDEEFVAFGNSELDLDLQSINAEEMEYDREVFDFVFIMGSLEHCYDPNKVASKIYQFLRPNGLFLIEGRFRPISYSYKYMNHNHHRYFREKSIQLFMIKHGFDPIFTTEHPICGSNTGREGNGFCLASKTDNSATIIRSNFSKALNCFDYLEHPEELIQTLKLHDGSLEKG